MNSGSDPSLPHLIQVHGTCGCKNHCANEQGCSKPRRFGVCEVEIQDAGIAVPSTDEAVDYGQ